MKFLNNLWPWKEIARLNGEIDFLKRTLEHEQSSHNLTRASLQDHKLELIDHRSRVAQGQKDIRKLATILAMKGGITILVLFLSMGAFGQPLQRQLFTTNTLPILSSISGPMVTTNGSGKPELTFNGAGLTNITGVAVAQGTNIITRTNGQVVTVNGVTDTNVVNILASNTTPSVVQGTNIVLTTNNHAVTINATTDTNVVNILITNATRPFFFDAATYMILASTVSANQTNFFAIHATTSKSTAETSAREVYFGNGRGAYVSNFWVYFNSTISTSTNLFFYLITNGVATRMGMNYTGNGSANQSASTTSNPFFVNDGDGWSIGMTNNSNLPSSLVFSWGIAVYPQ